MGVHGLWPLLEPVGRRIDIQAISNKRLAVGACLPSRRTQFMVSQQPWVGGMLHPPRPWVGGMLHPQPPPGRALALRLQLCRCGCNNSHHQSIMNFNLMSLCMCFTDASIWLYQFIRAMRTPDGEIMKNAHLLGFFRRICK